MTAARRTASWTRVGRGSFRNVLLAILALSAGIGVFIAVPMAQLGQLVSGMPVTFWLGYLASVIVVAVLIGPLLLPRATRAVFVDPVGARLRIGRRIVPAGAIQHAYRIPDEQADGRFQLQLAVPGLDPRIGISASKPIELIAADLDALIAVLRSAPITPDPDLPPRPPLAEELGPRDAAARFGDLLGNTLLPYQTVSFQKPSLLLELEAVRDAVAGGLPGVGTATFRDLGLVYPGTTHAPQREAQSAAATVVGGDHRRGFWGMLGSRHRAHRARVEEWLAEAMPVRYVAGYDWRWPVGWLVAIGGLLLPWIACGALGMLMFAVPGVLGMAAIAFALLCWPFITWAGLIVSWSASIRRYQRARRAAVQVRAGGAELPADIAEFFGPEFPEVRFANPFVVFLVSESVVLLSGGLLLVSLAFGQVENWAVLPAGLPIGVVLVVSSAPLFAWGVRVLARLPAARFRAVAIWRALTDGP